MSTKKTNQASEESGLRISSGRLSRIQSLNKAYPTFQNPQLKATIPHSSVVLSSVNYGVANLSTYDRLKAFTQAGIIGGQVTKSSDLVYKTISSNNTWTHKGQYLFLADNVIRLKPVNKTQKAFKVGDYTFLPEAQSKTLHFYLHRPVVNDFSLTIQKSHGTVINQGKIFLVLGLYKKNALKDLERVRNSNKQKFKDFRTWKFQALKWKDIQADFSDPGSSEIKSSNISVSQEEGQVFIQLALNELGATNWLNLAEQNRMHLLQSMCKISAKYYAQESRRLKAKKVQMNLPLNLLLPQVLPSDIHIINTQTSLDAQVIVQGNPNIKNVYTDFKPSRGYDPQSFIFDSSGGHEKVRFTGQDLRGLTIDVSHKVDFDRDNWPLITQKRTLSFSDTNWTEMVDPNSWMTKFTIMVLLVDRSGGVISNVDNSYSRIVCDLNYEADYLDSAIISTFETENQTIQEVFYPLPHGETPGRLRLSVLPFNTTTDNLEIPDGFITREFDSSSRTIVIKILPDNEVQITSNGQELEEYSHEEQMWQVAEDLGLISQTEEELASRPDQESAFRWSSDTPEFQKFLRYMRIDAPTFSAIEDWYFPEMEKYLIHEGILSPDDTLDRNSFHNAIAEFQSRNGLSIDGIPGANTLWKLQLDYAQKHPYAINRVDADRVSGYEEGYNSFRLREDAAFYYEGLREDVLDLGGVITSSGSLRSLGARVSAGRSSKSMHYTGIAFDLYIYSGMRNPDRDPYLIESDGKKWIVYCRVSSGGEEKRINAIYWENGRIHSKRVWARVINFTELASYYGFYNISRRTCFPNKYLCAEWWHFQNEWMIMPYFSQFGMEVLRLSNIDYRTLKKSPLWPNRKHIFQRSWF